MNSRSRQDVENLTVSFDHLHAPSSDSKRYINDEAVTNEEAVHCRSCGKDHPSCGIDYCPYSFYSSPKRYKLQNPNYYTTGGATKEPSVINEEPVRCRSCKKDHPAYNNCPYTPCTTCFKTGHDPWFCPFLSKIPKDAEFDKTNFQISCQCGNLFNVDKWVCTQCPGHPLLKRKFCNICCDFTQHNYYECPKDKVQAAAYKSCRDRLLSRPRSW